MASRAVAVVLLGAVGPMATAPTAAVSPPWVPWPHNVSLGPAGAGVTLTTAGSRVVFASPTLASAAAVLADDLLALHGLRLATAAGQAGGPADILLSLLPPQPAPASTPPPAPLPPPLPPPPVQCQQTPGTKLNNTDYADGNGPRTTASADECCQLCSETANCGAWSFRTCQRHSHPFTALTLLSRQRSTRRCPARSATGRR